MKISHVYRALVVHLHDGSVGLSRAAGPRPWAHFPRSCRDLYHTSRQLGDAAQYTARRPAPRLAAAGRLPILGRLWAPGAFLGVPQERPAKHQPGHYRRGDARSCARCSTSRRRTRSSRPGRASRRALASRAARTRAPGPRPRTARTRRGPPATGERVRRSRRRRPGARGGSHSHARPSPGRGAKRPRSRPSFNHRPPVPERTRPGCDVHFPTAATRRVSPSPVQDVTFTSQWLPPDESRRGMPLGQTVSVC